MAGPMFTSHNVLFALFIAGVAAAYVYFMWALPIMNLKTGKGVRRNNILTLVAAVFVLFFIILAVLANMAEKNNNY